MALNPFEETLRLEQSVLSPNLFHVASTSTLDIDMSDSLWNIDQRAVLFPADIPTDETSLFAQYIYDDTVSDKMNAALETFWSQNQVIIESPMSSKSKYFDKYWENPLRKTNAGQSNNPPIANPSDETLQKSTGEQNNEANKIKASNKSMRQDKICQTVLSFNPKINMFLHRNILESLNSRKKNFFEKDSENISIEQFQVDQISTPMNRSINVDHLEREIDGCSKRSNSQESDEINIDKKNFSRKKNFYHHHYPKIDLNDKEQVEGRANCKKRLESPNLSPIRACSSCSDSSSSRRKGHMIEDIENKRASVDPGRSKSPNSRDDVASLPDSEILINKELSEIIESLEKNDLKKKELSKNSSIRKNFETHNQLIKIISINSNVMLKFDLEEGKNVNMESYLNFMNKPESKNRAQFINSSDNGTSAISNSLNQDSQDTGYQTNSYEGNLSANANTSSSKSFAKIQPNEETPKTKCGSTKNEEENGLKRPKCATTNKGLKNENKNIPKNNILFNLNDSKDTKAFEKINFTKFGQLDIEGKKILASEYASRMLETAKNDLAFIQKYFG